LPLALPLAALAAPEARVDSTEGNKAVARRHFEDMWNRMDASVADEIVDPNVVGHVGAVTLHKREALKERVATIRGIYESSRFSIETMVAEGNLVAVRWIQRARHSGVFLGPQTKGKDVTVGGMHVFRLQGGRIVEIWVNEDDLGELQQLGVQVPSGV
jgi:predicted ester cyclase